MSILNTNDTVSEGDTVIVHVDFATLLSVRVDPTVREPTVQTKYGAIPYKNLIGHKYGTKYHCKKGYVFILRATPELWTKTLPFRTQILYLPDISMIIMHLDLRPGCMVGESGTGSGSLSHTIARTIAPHGHLYTFDYHDLRVQQAEKEFLQHGLNHVITARKADVYAEGYLELDGILDAILLDLPRPWVAVPKVKKALKRSCGGARIGSFSPCIEQVQRTCLALKQEGFADIVTLECLMRPLEVKAITVNCWNEPKEPEAAAEGGKPLKSPFSQTTFPATIVPGDVPGHSGYLTFASLF
ncbi:tRNA (adenine(58)-N(1))-methyltransferase catalytic subunit TRMT61A-like [Paramacrobiotus metropolitanus]|uniref:tRNA (adenine(58)-N(1))-methyltransferase catalytic subunit TRMT61A-like n=1 Tax=Paramacrobiotus metropolitanus TaxID=2943436 RepID=UPI002445CAE1|nr:tRNA (adenine(58)-N(1))-methyltransferase catalytic subunit TRMT61A-like [Paramacrobiotus metropolitanus]